MRLRVAPSSATLARRATRPGAAAIVGMGMGIGLSTTVLLGSLSACSTGGSAPKAAPAITSRKPAPSAAPTFNPMAGPIEAAGQLPKSCSKILTDTDLTAAFGTPQVGSTTYGNYAPLPNIGRTGRATCGFDIGIDQLGHPGPAGVIVSIITYNTAANAVGRVANEVNDSVAKGATAQPVLVSGHPATILFASGTAGPSPAASAPSSAASGTASSTSPAPASSAAAAAKPSASAGASSAGSSVTELLMADGNRTFVVDIPLSKVSGSAAASTLVNVMTVVYQHTLPPAAPSAPPSPTAPMSATAAPSATAASPKPSAH